MANIFKTVDTTKGSTGQKTYSLDEAIEMNVSIGKGYNLLGQMAIALGVEKPFVLNERGETRSFYVSGEALNVVEKTVKEL